MSKAELHEVVQSMLEVMGAEELLNDLCEAMSSDELQGNLEHIDRMQDLGLFVEGGAEC